MQKIQAKYFQILHETVVLPILNITKCLACHNQSISVLPRKNQMMKVKNFHRAFQTPGLIMLN